MLINLTGQIKNGEIKFDFQPFELFNTGQTVFVNEMSIKWKKSVSNIDGRLCSTLIDRNPYNPKQQLLYFYQKKSSNFTFVSPTRPAVYKIHCNSLPQSVFWLSLSSEHEIEKIYIQLDINEGIQQIHK